LPNVSLCLSSMLSSSFKRERPFTVINTSAFLLSFGHVFLSTNSLIINLSTSLEASYILSSIISFNKLIEAGSGCWPLSILKILYCGVVIEYSFKYFE